MVVLDSDLLVGILRNNEEAVSKMEKLEKEGEKLQTTVINTFELFEGALLHPKPDETTAKVEFLIRALDIFVFNQHASRMAAEISAELRRKGTIIDFQDISIAAIALSNNEKIVTRNIKHFSRIKNLRIEKW